jgi:tetratricopeptide (TPR) repeat protein
LILAVFLVYANVYENVFLYDDEFLIQRNALIRSWSGLWTIFTSSSTGGSGSVDSFYRPIQGFFYLVIYSIFGESLFGFHFLNVFLHALNAILVFGLGLKLKFDPRASFFAALLWAVHPIHTEAVTYMSATADPSYALFVMLGIFVGLPDFTGWKRLGSLACFALGLMSKESAIVMPALVCVCLWLTSDRARWKWRSYLRSWPFWLLAGAYFVARRTILDFNQTFEFYRKPNAYTENISYRIFTALATLPEYKKLLLWPDELHIDRGFPVYTSIAAGPVILGLIAVIVAVAWSVWAYRRGRLSLPWGFSWFAASHSPHTGILVAVNAFFLEHWMYLPSVGLFLGLANSLFARLKKKWVKWTVAAVYLIAILALSWRTWEQNKVWADPITFYTHILRFSPDVPRVHNNLGMAYADQGKFEDAIREYKETLRLMPNLPQPYHNLGQIHKQMGQIDEAIKYYELALKVDEHFFYSAYELSQIWAARGNRELATRYKAQADAAKGILRR